MVIGVTAGLVLAAIIVLIGLLRHGDAVRP